MPCFSSSALIWQAVAVCGGLYSPALCLRASLSQICFEPTNLQAVPCPQAQCLRPTPLLRARAFVPGPRRTDIRQHPVCALSMDLGSTALLLAAAAEDVSKPGSVDAPIGIVIGAALLVTVVLTFAIPAALNPGATWCTLPVPLSKLDYSLRLVAVLFLSQSQTCLCTSSLKGQHLTHTRPSVGTDAAERIFERDAKSGRRR
jgi:hypothetical protein